MQRYVDRLRSLTEELKCMMTGNREFALGKTVSLGLIVVDSLLSLDVNAVTS